MSTRIAIVDDDARLRTQLVRTIGRFPECTCIAECSSGEDALETIPKDPPDVVLMDINMKGMSGIECVRQLKPAHPEIEFIMLTVYQDGESIFKSLMVGATGYVLKSAVAEELLDAIRQVRQGGSPMTGLVARRVVQAFRHTDSVTNDTVKLSAREREVLKLLAEGYIYKEIAESLQIAYGTVHNHIRHIYEKLHVRSRAQAVKEYYAQLHPQPQELGNLNRRST